MAEYIDREKLLRDINHYHLSDGKFQHWVEVQQAADVAPVRHGRWEEYLIPNILCCSNCDWGIDPLCKSPYCPNCGADMREKED